MEPPRQDTTQELRTPRDMVGLSVTDDKKGMRPDNEAPYGPPHPLAHPQVGKVFLRGWIVGAP